jgi:hypothetical protein
MNELFVGPDAGAGAMRSRGIFQDGFENGGPGRVQRVKLDANGGEIS